MEFEEAQQYRDEYIQGKRDAGLQVSDRNGFYISSSIKDQGKTGSLYASIMQAALPLLKGYSMSETASLLCVLACTKACANPHYSGRVSKDKHAGLQATSSLRVVNMRSPCHGILYKASSDSGQHCIGVLLHCTSTAQEKACSLASYSCPVKLSVRQPAMSVILDVQSLYSTETARPIVTCTSVTAVISLQNCMCSAGHTWVLLATQVRRTSQHGPLHYRIQRPQNITCPDMPESGLSGVRALSMLHWKMGVLFVVYFVLLYPVVLFWQA